MLKTGKLDERLPFGASVHGLTAEMIADPAVRAELKDLWVRESLLVFRDCPATPAFHVALGKSLGELMVHRSTHILVEACPSSCSSPPIPSRRGSTGSTASKRSAGFR